MEHKRIVVTNGALTETEKSLSLEERDKTVIDEIENMGFIRDYRLIDRQNIPKREGIRFKYTNGAIEFTELPGACSILIFVFSDNDLRIFDTDNLDLALAYPDSHIITINKPKEGVYYDLFALSDGHLKNHLINGETYYFSNMIATPHYYGMIDFSMIDITLLKDGYVAIDLINTHCHSISFSKSQFFENALDLRINADPQEGDIYLTGIKDKLVIYHPILRMALMNQASIGILDRINGSFYAHVTFYYFKDAFNNCFVDILKVRNESCLKKNLNLFCSFK